MSASENGIVHRRDQRRRPRRIRAGVLGATVALAVALAGACALLTGSTPINSPAPTPSSPPGVDDGPALYLVDPATGESELILEGAGGLDEPEYAPNDARLVYQRKAEDGTPQIFVLKDGKSDQLTDVRGGAFEPTWSPDGTQIAFVARSDRRDGGRRDTDIFVMDADGSDVRNVAGTEWNDGHPDWSPDGSRLVFHSIHRLNPYVMRGEIWLMDLDTGELTSHSRDGYGGGTDPAWAPDGASIVFTGITLSTLNGRMPYAPLWVVPSDGPGNYPLDGSRRRRYGQCRFDATWSPAGSAVAFTEDSPQTLRVFDVQRGVVTSVTLSTPIVNLSWGTEGIVASVGRDVAPVFEFGCYDS